MNIVISGASGLVGTALQERLRAEGHSVTNLVRKAPSNANESQWDPVAGSIDTDVIAQADAVINLSGAGIGDRRWSQSYRKTLLDQKKVLGISLLINLKRFSKLTQLARLLLVNIFCHYLIKEQHQRCVF